MTSEHPLYRVYHLNSAGGITQAEVLDAADDASAILQATVASIGRPVELWDRGRFVIKLDARFREPAPEPTSASGIAL